MLLKMSSIISVLSNVRNLSKELKYLIPNAVFKNIVNEDDYEQLKKSEIVIADFDLIQPHIYTLHNTKWVQGTWAGVNKIINGLDATKPLPFIINRYSDVHFGRLMSEYVVTNIVNHERNFFGTYENCKIGKWSRAGKIFNHRMISDLTIGILGVGNIGNHIGKTLNFFGGKVWGFGKRNRSLADPEYSHLTEYCTFDDLPKILRNCDYIVNVLPETNETIGLLNADVLKNCEGKDTVFINIGRGTIINEDDLINAIEQKWISAAILDVFIKEPLSATSKLWSYKEIFITPHVSGVSRARDIAEFFKENLIRYQNGQELPNQIVVEKGY